ncbi:hypothetical protein CEE67_09220 [Limosilactobacillus fermentum]|nr:hypothetical protein CEE67_09220 [Limosilactobacillus fermentum]
MGFNVHPKEGNGLYAYLPSQDESKMWDTSNLTVNVDVKLENGQTTTLTDKISPSPSNNSGDKAAGDKAAADKAAADKAAADKAAADKAAAATVIVTPALSCVRLPNGNRSDDDDWLGLARCLLSKSNLAF